MNKIVKSIYVREYSTKYILNNIKEMYLLRKFGRLGAYEFIEKYYAKNE